MAESHGDDQQVDIGRDDLRLGGGAGHLAGDGAVPGQHGLDRGRALLGARSDSDPVADGRQFAGSGVVQQAAGDGGGELPLAGGHVDLASSLGHHPRRNETGRYLRGIVGVPAQLGEGGRGGVRRMRQNGS